MRPMLNITNDDVPDRVRLVVERHQSHVQNLACAMRCAGLDEDLIEQSVLEAATSFEREVSAVLCLLSEAHP